MIEYTKNRDLLAAVGMVALYFNCLDKAITILLDCLERAGGDPPAGWQDLAFDRRREIAKDLVRRSSLSADTKNSLISLLGKAKELAKKRNDLMHKPSDLTANFDFVVDGKTLDADEITEIVQPIFDVHDNLLRIAIRLKGPLFSSRREMRQVLVYRGEDGFWIAECLSLPGCVSQGETKDDARRSIQEAIQLHIDTLVADQLPIPEDQLDARLVTVSPPDR